jgi:5-methylcytosine-specific restriction endonuclease McrA
MQGMGVSSEKELLLMASALKDNGSTSQWRKIRQRILQRDGYTCQHCGMDGNSVDHIVPRSAGGGDHDWNLQTLCTSCNSAKGGRFFSSTKTPLTLPVLNSPKNDSKSHEND